jgi:predicted nucleic acid-binding protein
MTDICFVDTSVWIDYFRESDSARGEVIESLIRDDRIVLNGIVLTELLTGARSPKEFDQLASALGGLRLLEMPPSFFEAAGRYGRLLKSVGVSIPLSDLLIATHCLDGHLVLLENDRHFAAIAAHLPLRLLTD